jgi:hypothetical protein
VIFLFLAEKIKERVNNFYINNIHRIRNLKKKDEEGEEK